MAGGPSFEEVRVSQRQFWDPSEEAAPVPSVDVENVGSEAAMFGPRRRMGRKLVKAVSSEREFPPTPPRSGGIRG